MMPRASVRITSDPPPLHPHSFQVVIPIAGETTKGPLFPMYHNNHSQPQWQNNNNSYPPLSTTPARKPTSYDPSTPINVNLSPHPNNMDRARMMRTPSPTPSEQKELSSGAIDWKTLMNWRFWLRREWLWYYVALVIILVITALVTLYHEQIVHWLTPVTQELQKLKFGWLVPIGILFVISFPPLFGHEIVAILCGLVWGLWIGFGIVSAGTFLGEVGNYYAFRYICTARGEKMEKNKISYACLARVVRDGGFWIALIARYSAIPGHFTTAVFSTCGMGIFVFSIAAILSMPKQLITVYLGVILEQSSSGTEDTKSKIISRVVLTVTVLVTVVAMWYILRKMNQVKPTIIYERRKARQAKLTRASLYGNNELTGSEMFVGNNSSLTDIPLSVPTKKNSDGISGSGHGHDDYGYGYGAGGKGQYPFSSDYQHSNAGSSTYVPSGHGHGYESNDNIVYAPKPRQPEEYYSPANRYQNYRGDEGAGHVAPGAAIVGMRGAYDYTPTRQDSDGDTTMAAQQEDYLRRHQGREPTFPPPGIMPSSPTRQGPQRVLTSSPDAVSTTGQSLSSLPYLSNRSTQSQTGSLSQSHSTPVHSSSLHQSNSIPPLPSSPNQNYFNAPANSIYPSSQSYPNNAATTSQPFPPSSVKLVSPYPETREVSHQTQAQRPPSGILPNPYNNDSAAYPHNNGGGGHVVEPTDASFHTAIDHGAYGTSYGGHGYGHAQTREPSLVESELHAPGAFPSDPPPSYTVTPR
ncbi:hypothetical protein VKT23_009254 [Stygiomarasmius scandens]|uniref:Golgi apparatus membrane protein TVP38 n=1 Tax=Marasmiellus scandens TaxID=2682957 RepID=A0ABR1JJ13_9AGAR